jgi:sn-glycerol 3-phosphate transport system permease protein
MEKSAVFNSKLLPYLLLVPQLIITFVFFYWPASQAVWQSFLREDAFGLSSEFIGLENYQALFAQPEYYKAMLTTLVFSSLVAALSLSIALLFATQADKNLKAAPVYKTFMIWPYAVAPAVAGVLWFFMFHPSLGTLARPLRWMGFDWNPLLNGNHAMILVVMAAVWKQISYNFWLGCSRSLKASSKPARLTAPVRCGGSGPSFFRCCRRPRSFCWSSTSSTCSSIPSASSMR